MKKQAHTKVSPKVNRKVVYVLTSFALLGIIAVSVNNVNASFYGLEKDTIVSTLSQKLGVSEDKVQKAFDEIHSDRRAEMESRYQDMLSQAVKDGKLTEAQKKLLIAKHNELFSQRETHFDELKNMTPQERKAKMQKRRDELENWAQQNDIDPSYLAGFGKGHKMRMRMEMH